MSWGHWVFHYLDWMAASATLTGILLLAHRKRSGWVVTSMGSVLWLIIAATSVFAGRPVYGQMVLSGCTLVSNYWGWKKWKING